MKKRVTLNLSDDILSRALEVAARSRRDVEAVLEEWIDRYVDDLPVDALTDEQVLALCDYEMNVFQKHELRDLLYSHRARKLSDQESMRMDQLLHEYRRGIIRKARAIEVAVARGLKDREGVD